MGRTLIENERITYEQATRYFGVNENRKTYEHDTMAAHIMASLDLGCLSPAVVVHTHIRARTHARARKTSNQKKKRRRRRLWVASKVSEHEASCGSPESTASFGDARVSAAAATVTVFVSIEFRPRRGCVVVVWWWCVAARTRKFLVTVKKFFANPPSPMVTVARGSRRCDRHRRPRRPQAPPAQPRRPIRATCPTATRVCRQRPESRAPPSPSSPWRPPRMFLSSSSSSYFSTAAFDAPGIAQVWRPLFSSSSRARSHPGVEAQQSVGEKKNRNVAVSAADRPCPTTQAAQTVCR